MPISAQENERKLLELFSPGTRFTFDGIEYESKICRDRAIQKDRDTKEYSSWMLGYAQKNRKDYRETIHHEDDKGCFRWVSKNCLDFKYIWLSNEISQRTKKTK